MRASAIREMGIERKAFKTARGAQGHAKRRGHGFVMYRPFGSRWVLNSVDAPELGTEKVQVFQDADNGEPVILFSLGMREQTMSNIAYGFSLALGHDWDTKTI